MTNRLDNSHDLSYPTAPDARGSTRVNFRRRPYYLGPHDSPLSHIMFGLWKHHLNETGDAPATKDLRPIAEQLLQSGTIAIPDKPSKNRLLASYALAAVGFSLAFFLSLKIAFSGSQPEVDGIAMSEAESDIVRGLRTHESKVVENATKSRIDLAGTLLQFNEMGSENGAFHTEGQTY